MLVNVFISYCHTDSEYQDRLMQHLKPLERIGCIQCWSDRKIKAGQKWKDEISEAISRSAVSILLVSADFLASDFIMNEEISKLLKHTKVFPILIHQCYLDKQEWLKDIQFVNDTETPLSEMSKAKQEKVLAQLTKSIIEYIENEFQ